MTKKIAAYGGQGLNRGEGTLSPPPTGDRPLSPPQRATGPFFFPRDLIANLKKKLHLRPVALWGATGGYFSNISKRTYIFKILIFKKYRKEKTANSTHPKLTAFSWASATLGQAQTLASTCALLRSGGPWLQAAVGASRDLCFRAISFHNGSFSGNFMDTVIYIEN